jgi:hypothetical protein
MATTYEIIAKTIVGSGGVANIDFTSIPSTYTDLMLSFSFRSSSSGEFDNIDIKFNNSSSDFSSKRLIGSGSSVSSSSLSSGVAFLAIDAFNATASTFSNSQIYIPNYASSNYKSFSGETVAEDNATTAYQYLSAGLWSNTAAINQITLTASNTLVQYSSAYLYGIKNS